MALIDKASLLMVPSTYEDGTLYNVLPTGNKAPDETGNHNGYDQTRADFTFSRGSNLAATRVNSDGLIEKGRENLLLQSNQFDTTWTNSNTTETSGQEGYDGTNNAWKLTKSAANGYIQQQVTFVGVNTLSVYVKADSSNWVALMRGDGQKAFFDLSGGGALGTVTSGITSKIESVGNDWFRCSFTFSNSSTNYARIYVADGNNDISGTSGSIFIQNAQLEKGLIASDVITTTTATAQAGILEDMPRINYDANGENGALLLEPQRSNLLRHSEYFSFWVNNGASITDNSTTSPEGVQNASTITGVSGNNRIYLLETTASGTTYTLSFYAKKGTSSTIGLDFINVSSGTTFNFDTKTWGTNAAWDSFDYEELSNGWFRLYGIIDSNTTSAGIGIYVESGETAYIWGAQLEAGSYSSSLIPTHGAAVTRGADSCSVTGVSDVIGQTSGSFYAEVNSDAGGFRTMSICDGSTNNRMTLAIDSDDYIKLIPVTGGSVRTQLSATYVSGVVKICCTYNASAYDFFVNGTKVGTDSRTAFSGTLDEVRFDQGNGGNQFFGDAVKMIVFDEELTDAEAIALTTL